VVVGQEGGGDKERYLPGVVAPGEGAVEAAGCGAQRTALGLPHIVVTEVGQVFQGLSPFVSGCEILGDDF